MLRPRCSLLLAGLLAGLLAAPSFPAAAAIRNVATATWSAGAVTATARSNAVVIETGEAGAAAPALSVLRPDTDAGRVVTSATAPRCRAAGGSRVVTLAPGGAGKPFLFKLTDPAGDLDPAAVDTLVAVLVTRGGDRETLEVRETGVDTGEFTGFIRTASAPPAPTAADCVLSLTDDDAVRVESERDGAVVASNEVAATVEGPVAAPVVTKTASQATAAPGDVVLYTVAARNPDARGTLRGATLPAAMRLRPGTVRVDGRARPEALTIAADGRTLSVALPPIGPGITTTVRYALEVRPDARPGDAVNRALIRDANGTPGVPADALVRIEREVIAGRLTIVGRVLDGGCRTDPRAARGVPGVRVMLEDGSYSVSDEEGRYHFEGVRPGTHVVQIDPATLPRALKSIDCARTTRSGGSAISRFVEGGGGALLRADFHAETSGAAPAAAPAPTKAAPVSDAKAAGAERDWFSGGGTGIAWLFPEPDHNPRSPAVRVAIRHRPGQTVALSVGGKPVDPVAFEGARTSPDGASAVSLWRGIALTGRDTRMSAQVRGADGAPVATLERAVHFAASPMRAVLVPERSRLVADGVTRPRVAFRLLDRDGRPVHHGLTGEFGVSAPYLAAVEVDARQARQLSGLERARPARRVEGDDGVAVLELEPTSVSGAVTFTLPMRDGDVRREQRLEAWLDAGDRPWTIVGFAAGSAGFGTLSGRMEAAAADGDKLDADGRVALYASGRVQGRWLMTMAYDSGKRQGDARFGGVIDPQTYYTVYADRSERRFDAASVRKLYLRLERPQFHALFGDYETGINEPQLARYNRALNGAKAEYRGPRAAALAFAADTPNGHRREELQGTGLSGPYQLGARDILANSERVVIEVRDRLRSERIVDRRVMTRHIDYDIDYRAGTLRFKAPVLSRSSDLDPQFVVADYETDGVARRHLNAGGRAARATGCRRA